MKFLSQKIAALCFGASLFFCGISLLAEPTLLDFGLNLQRVFKNIQTALENNDQTKFEEGFEALAQMFEENSVPADFMKWSEEAGARYFVLTSATEDFLGGYSEGRALTRTPTLGEPYLRWLGSSISAIRTGGPLLKVKTNITETFGKVPLPSDWKTPDFITLYELNFRLKEQERFLSKMELQPGVKELMSDRAIKGISRILSSRLKAHGDKISPMISKVDHIITAHLSALVIMSRGPEGYNLLASDLPSAAKYLVGVTSTLDGCALRLRNAIR